MRLWPPVGAAIALLVSVSAKKSGDTELVEELTAETFVEKVEKVANGTGKPAYAPVVMFHMPWCEHCRKTIPELKETSEKVAEAAAKGQLQGYPAVPRFFMLSCDEPGVDDICKRHTGKTYPSIIVFRDERAVKFNRPRVASVITWWVFRVARPAIERLDTKEHLARASQREVAFLLHVKSTDTEDEKLVRCWEQLGLDYIEEYIFLFTFGSSPLGKSLGPSPGVNVYGPDSLGLEPLPAEDPLDEDTLRAWVKKNQFPPVVEVSPWTLSDLHKTGLRVVTLVHAGNAVGQKAMAEFRRKASELRRGSSYLFAMINSTDEDSAYLIQSKFSLLAPGVDVAPRVFVFAGAGGGMHFWEDPGFPAVEGLSLEAVEGLLKSPEAFHDESYGSWIKGKRKAISRFALKSWTAFLLTVAMPLVVLAVCCMCCRAVCQALFLDEGEEEEPAPGNAAKHSHAD